MATVKSVEGLTVETVAQLRTVADFIDRAAEELVGDMEGEPIAEDGLVFTIELSRDSLPTVTAHKTFIVLPRLK